MAAERHHFEEHGEKRVEELRASDEASSWEESVVGGLFQWVPPEVDRPKEGPVMKSLRAILCLVFALLLVGLLAFQAVAERPQSKEIRDKIMWGDPDDLVGCRKSGVLSREVNGPPDSEFISRPMPRMWTAELALSLGIDLSWCGYVVGRQEDRDSRTFMIRVPARSTRR